MRNLTQLNSLFRVFMVVGAVFTQTVLAPHPLLLAAPAAESATGIHELVNVNDSSAEDLTLIQGVGPVLAERIIAYRDEFGPFDTVDELSNVRGIGGAKLQKIKQQVIV